MVFLSRRVPNTQHSGAQGRCFFHYQAAAPTHITQNNASGGNKKTACRASTQNGAGGHPLAPSVKSARRSGAHGALVVLHQVDAALVALVAAEGGLQERVDEGESLFLSVLTGTDGHDVRVVVLAG